MANKIQIFTDTGSDLIDLLKENDINIIPLYVTFDGKNYLKQIEDISIDDFYEKQKVATIAPKTSLPAVMDYINAFTPYLKNGDDILCLALNSNFSGAYQSAISAKEMLAEDYPNSRIEIVDTENVTFMQATLTMQAKKLLDERKDLDYIINAINVMKKNTFVSMTVDTLKYLKEGGRISNTSAFIGDLLNIKPIIIFKDTKLTPVSKVRGKNKALKNLVELVENEIDGDVSNYKFAVLHGNVPDEADDFIKSIKEESKIKDIISCPLGICMGVHTGPGLLGIAMVKIK